jgi:hypothetical protein
MGKIVKKPANRVASSKSRNDGADRVRKHRAKMKALGLKPVTLWLPDTSTPEFKAQIAREVALINADKDGMRVMDEMLALADFSDWK